MARHKKHPEHENLERWLVSYADFITLLFATFTALYAISTADMAKLQRFKAVAESISQSFEDQSLMSGIKSVMQGKSPPNKNPDAIMKDPRGKGEGVMGQFDSLTYKKGNIEAEPQEDVPKSDKEALEELERDIKLLNQALQTAMAQLEGDQAGDGKEDRTSTDAKNASSDSGPDPIELITNERGTTVRIESRLLFDPGSAELKPSARKALAAVASKLRSLVHQNRVQVEGHTDDQPIHTALYPSNWELSTARASAVVRYLIGVQGFPSAQMAATGYASSRPVLSNTTPTGRSHNRRIEIALLQAENPSPSDDAAIASSPSIISTGAPRSKLRERPLSIRDASEHQKLALPTSRPKSGPVVKPEDQLLFQADEAG